MIIKKYLVFFSGTWKTGLDLLLVCRITKSLSKLSTKMCVPLLTNGETEGAGGEMTCQGNQADQCQECS